MTSTTFGVPSKSYCSNIARTFLVDPSEKIQAMYELLVDAEEHILSELKHGAKLSSVYNSTVEMVKKEKPEMVISLHHALVGCYYPQIAAIL